MTDRYEKIRSVEAPERIWIESDGECPYFYHEEELSDVGSPVTEYVRADKLRAEIEALRAEVARLEVIAGYGGVSSDAPERLILASEVYDGVQPCDKWCDVRRVVDDGQPMPESATAYVRADRAERLEEALRELVDVFSESGMYDEEVFDKARAALAHGGEE